VPLVPLSLCRIAIYLVTWLIWFCDPRGRRIVAANLAPAIGCRAHGPLRRAVRRSYVSFGFSIVESLHLHQIPAKTLHPPEFTITDPWGLLRDPPIRGPRILATLHANFELAPALLHQRGELETLHAVSLSHGDPIIDGLFDRYRAAAGVRSLLLDQAPLASLRALHKGAVVGIVGDRDYTGGGGFVKICGQRLCIPVGPAALAVQTGAIVVPSFLARRGHSRYQFFAGRPLQADPNLPKREEIQRICRRLAIWYERCLIAAPSQWVAFHPVWGRASKDLGASPTWV
jgi:lauroyl/myristoyl acyltransferase